MKNVYVVTYWDDYYQIEPVVTVFDNKEMAEKCFEYFKNKYEGCCLDECRVFSTFSCQ